MHADPSSADAYDNVTDAKKTLKEIATMIMIMAMRRRIMIRNT